MCLIAPGVVVGASHDLDLMTAAPLQQKAFERRQKQRLRKRYFRALDAGREPPEAALLLGDEFLHKQAQARQRSTAQAPSANMREAPDVHTIDAVVMELKRAPMNTAPPPASATPPIQLIEKSQETLFQPLQVMSGPILWCAVQDVRPVTERVVVPMVVVDMIPAVSKEKVGADTDILPSKQCTDVSQDMSVVEATSGNPHMEYSDDHHLFKEKDWLPKEFVLPVSIKKTFIEVEDPLMDYGQNHKVFRAQSLPSRRRF